MAASAEHLCPRPGRWGLLAYPSSGNLESQSHDSGMPKAAHTAEDELIELPILLCFGAFSFLLMVSRRELRRTGRKVFIKPLVVLAAKCLGPGRLRLEMVKLAHDLEDRDESFQSLYGRSLPQTLPPYEAPSQRAA